jgi:predicted short-subunit dehydrogenase-like oxidoreductase (DUF2520 family)
MLARCMSRTISIVGAGRVGTTLGKRLHERGWRIGAVVTRSAKTSRAAVRTIGAGTAYANLHSNADPSHAPQSGSRAQTQPRRNSRSSTRASAPKGTSVPALSASDVILLTVQDDSLPAVVRLLAHFNRVAWRDKIVLHASGTLDSKVLAPLSRRGASVGSLHPMQTFGGKIIPKLTGVIFAIEGDPEARRIATQIAKSLGGFPVSIASHDKAIYHAAAVLAAGSSFPLIESGLGMLMRIGFTRQRAMQTLLPLIRQILDNIERIGPRAAWTGPLSRGDYAIVARHAKALRSYPRELRQSYAALALLAGQTLAKNRPAALIKIKRALKV